MRDAVICIDNGEPVSSRAARDEDGGCHMRVGLIENTASRRRRQIQPADF